MSLVQPLLMPVPDSGGQMMVMQDFQITLHDDRILTVLKGFIFDGASIPPFAWSIIDTYPFDPDILSAALAHDALYESELLSRGEADRELEILMPLNSKKGQNLHFVFFLAVRAGGGEVWAKHTPESITEARKFCSISQ